MGKPLIVANEEIKESLFKIKEASIGYKGKIELKVNSVKIIVHPDSNINDLFTIYELKKKQYN